MELSIAELAAFAALRRLGLVLVFFAEWAGLTQADLAVANAAELTV